MPHVLVIAAGAVSLVFAFRWVRKEFDRVDASLRRADRRIKRASADAATPLIFDTTSGIYRPLE